MILTMPPPRENEITQLLARVPAGDQKAAELLMPVIYDQLHKLARHHLRNERPDHTLQTHENHTYSAVIVPDGAICQRPTA